jgi:hypothetical protein
MYTPGLPVSIVVCRRRPKSFVPVQNAAKANLREGEAVKHQHSFGTNQVALYSAPSPSRTSLTVSSRGTRMLRIRAPQLWR